MAARKRTYMEVHHALDVDRTADGVAPATEGKWLYDNTLGAWVLSYDTLPYVPVERVSVADNVPRPEQPPRGPSSILAQSVYRGASYFTERPLLFNRIRLRLQGNTNPYTGNISIYQRADGDIGAQVPLVASFSWSDLSGTLTLSSDAGGDALLVRGVYWCIYGIVAGAGNFTVNSWDMGGLSMFNNLVPNGAHPTSFETSTAPASPGPATFDPLEGGADGVSALTLDIPLVWRFLRV